MARLALADEIAAVSALCRDLGLGLVAPTLLKAAHHTTLLLAPLGLVARVQSAEPIDAACRTAVLELAVARHLAARDAPTLAPLDVLAGPHVAGPSVVTLWPHAAYARTAGDADAALAAATLEAVHRALSDYAGALPPYTHALDRCRRMLAADCAALTAADRHLLAAHFGRLRRQVEAAARAPVPLHGDAHPGNLLLGGERPLWIDFEDACIGPREYDIANLPPAAWPRFADADRTLVAACADLKSVCVAIWCSADIARSAEMREAAAYHLDRVRGFPVWSGA